MSYNPQQFKVWHDHYRPRLFKSMTAVFRDKDTAEDVTSAALASAWRNMNKFRGDSSLYTWVYRIALNEARNRLRRKSAVSLDAIVAAAPEALREPDRVCDAAERSDTYSRLWKALGQIPPLYRRVLTDHFVHGYSTKQIARREGIPLNTVLSRIFTGKRQLRRAWESVP